MVLAGLLLFVVLLLVLRYVPDRNLVDVGSGDAVPNRGDLMKVAIKWAVRGTAFLLLTGLAAGWVLAGQMLRPLEKITRVARSTTCGSLSHRIALPGRDDELRRLADTFDQMLEQLEAAFEEQRRFTANVSHELRTPQTVIRTMLQVAQANPGALKLETFLGRLQEMNDRSIDTHEALLQLARLERDDLPRRPCDLAQVTRDVLRSPGVVNDLQVRDILSTIDALDALDAVMLQANPPLLRQLVDNLVRNAVLHNLPTGGTVWVDVTSDECGRARLRVANTGAVIAAEGAVTLTEPFVRGAGRTRLVSGPGGSGLGLAIVSSVARAHGAGLSIQPRPGGGLIVTVIFPRTPPSPAVP